MGSIKVNDKRSTANYRLTEGDCVTLFKNFEEFNIQHDEKEDYVLSKAERAELESWIIFEDDEICLINKPYGLSVQGGTDIHKHLDGMLKCFKKGVNYHLVHRLDKDTSGLLLLAKSHSSANFLSLLFKERKIEKTYVAVVHGQIRQNEFMVDVPLLKDFKGSKELIVVSPSGKSARTLCHVLYRKKEYTLVELKPLTGRTHQLRVHMSHIGHPIVGDYKYGSIAKQGVRLHLHAKSLTFPYGDKKADMTFHAPLLQEDYFSLFDDIA